MERFFRWCLFIVGWMMALSICSYVLAQLGLHRVSRFVALISLLLLLRFTQSPCDREYVRRDGIPPVP